VHYYFITREEFEEKINSGGMLEYAEYVGNYYGTPKETVENALDSGKDVILEIEVKGAKKIKEKCPDAIFVFIKPPSLEELERRLIGRGTEKMEVIKKRLSKAIEEMENESLYTYSVVNDDVDSAAADIAAIIRSEKLKI
jgi:guanylate kinase